MDYYTKLLKMGCFSLEDVAALTDNINTAGSVLRANKKKGRIVSVRRNLYAAINPLTDEPVPTPYEIASHISPDSYVSHHSAFEMHGMANQVFSDMYVSSTSKFNPFEFDGRRFLRIESKFSDGVKTVGKVRVTDLERTIVDSIKDFTKIGGLEELLRCLVMVTYADAEKLTHYLTLYDNQFLWQKTGYILSNFPNIKLPSEFFSECKNHIEKSVRYLYPELKFEGSDYASEWCIFVPKNMMELLGEGGTSLV